MKMNEDKDGYKRLALLFAAEQGIASHCTNTTSGPGNPNESQSEPTRPHLLHDLECGGGTEQCFAD